MRSPTGNTIPWTSNLRLQPNLRKQVIQQDTHDPRPVFNLPGLALYDVPDETQTSLAGDQTSTVAIDLNHSDWLRSAHHNSRQDRALSQVICQALRRSGYPLDDVDCWCDDQTLVLTGRVTRYFFAQMALETARPFAGHRLVEIQIDVIPLIRAGYQVDDSRADLG
jgi:hypothetical protein